MIAPRIPGESDERPRLNETAAFFSPGGGMARGFEVQGEPYEQRPQQTRMAEAVASSLAERRHLAVEAGTGVGKSFAYLVPMILCALDRGIGGVVSTHTISLQEQLIGKDIPFLRKHLGHAFTAVLVKGRSNYLCLRRLRRVEQMAGDLFRVDETEWLAKIHAWAEVTEDGSVQSFPGVPPPAVWSSVCAEEGNCTAKRCRHFGRCFFMTARRRMANAHVLVVNHHLFFSDLALRMQDAAFLPRYETVVFDEAHQVEDVAGAHLGLRLSEYSVRYWLRRLLVPDTGKGLLSVVRHGPSVKIASGLWEAFPVFFSAVREAAGLAQSPVRRLHEPLALETGFPAAIDRMTLELGMALEGALDDDLRAELSSVRRRGEALRDALNSFLEQREPDHVYWIESQGRSRQTVLNSAPIEVGPILERVLFGQVPSVVLTSATLAVNGSMDYFRHRLGAREAADLAVGSPFDFARQMRVLIPRELPEPTDTEGFVPAASTAILHFVRLSRGRAFVLFTSAVVMRRVAEVVRDALAVAGLRLLVQGEMLSRDALLHEFRKGEGAVLFGLDSFWMGVDVRGEALSNVILARLPFSVPDHPLTQARSERIRARGGDAFRDYALPEAVIKFRQGIGRLIRTTSDSGWIVILDRRVVTRWYGRWFLRAVEDAPVELVDVEPSGGDPF